MEADITIHIKEKAVKELLTQMGDEGKRFFQVADFNIVDEKTDTMEEYDNSFIFAEKSTGQKCVRCWNYSDDLASDDKHPELCKRCTDIVSKIK